MSGFVSFHYLNITFPRRVGMNQINYLDELIKSHCNSQIKVRTLALYIPDNVNFVALPDRFYLCLNNFPSRITVLICISSGIKYLMSLLFQLLNISLDPLGVFFFCESNRTN